ncbi:MAG: putative nucleotidyltransferase with HDIG domain [Oceanospirillaceae bacterium]|jgi:putative nucleotidyltransferase with HDIG domain
MSTTSNKLNLKNIYKRIGHLPLLPSVVCDLMQLDPDSIHFLEQIEDLSKHEPSLAVRVLQIANSVQASPMKPITDIHQALIRTGSDDILSFLSRFSVTKVLTPMKSDERNLWRHSIETAYLSEYIARANPKLLIDPNLAYSCGLLHDIGRFVLFNVASKSIDFLESKDWKTPSELSDTETQFFGFTHAEVGSLAAQRWKLPAVITQVITHHHNYSKIDLFKFPDNFKNLLQVIQLSDFISTCLEKNANWKDFNQQQLLDEIQNNWISKLDNQFAIDTVDLVNTIPLIVNKSNESMMKLRLA